jgi:dGTPase
MADDIAYNNHDIDDGLRAGLFDVADLAEVPLVGPVFAEVSGRFPGLETARLVHESIRRLIDRMATDLIEESRRRLAESRPRSVDDVRRAGRALIGFSAAMGENDRALKSFLFERMYRHYKVNRMTSKARHVVRELFDLYLAQPDCLPTEWRAQAAQPGSAATARLVADYIAGMTDRFALDEHQRLFDVHSRP